MLDIISAGIPIDGALDDRCLEIIKPYVCKATTLLEIGTCWGRTAINLARMSPSEAIVYTLDIRPRDLSCLQAYPAELAKIRFLAGDSKTFDFISALGGRRPDVIIVDGDHTYEAALLDTRTALLLAARTGVIFWHDYYNSPETCVHITRVKAALYTFDLPIHCDSIRPNTALLLMEDL